MSNKQIPFSSTHEIFSGWNIFESIHTTCDDYPTCNKNAQSIRQKRRKNKILNIREQVTRCWHWESKKVSMINHQQSIRVLIRLVYYHQIVALRRKQIHVKNALRKLPSEKRKSVYGIELFRSVCCFFFINKYFLE